MIVKIVHVKKKKKKKKSLFPSKIECPIELDSR